MEGKDGMIKPTINLQDLRRRIYIKAKAEPAWRFWGLYVHVCKIETLHTAYDLAKQNNGAPGIDGVTFEAIEQAGREGFLQQIRQELVNFTYCPTRNRKREIPKSNGKFRTLGIPTIKDRVVQGALKLILEPIFEADFQSGSYGYRPRRTAHEAIDRVAQAIVYHKTRVIDIDLHAYFDNVQHHILLEKVVRRVNDDDIMRLVKMILKANGKKGVTQGGVITPQTMLQKPLFRGLHKRGRSYPVNYPDGLVINFNLLYQGTYDFTAFYPIHFFQITVNPASKILHMAYYHA
jgi:RNA-directed DNA polymerase